MGTDLAIIGAGGHAVSVCNVAISAGFTVVAFVDDDNESQTLMGIDILPLRTITAERSVNSLDELCFAIGIGTNFIRENVFLEYKSSLPIDRFPVLIHPSAVVSINTTLGSGTILMPNATVGPNSHVGKFCVLNTNSVIDHDCAMLDYSSIGPGVVTGGNVTIAERSAISIGTAIKHGISIGSDAVIGANSYVNNDLASGSIYYGTPAKFVEYREPYDNYLD